MVVSNTSPLSNLAIIGRLDLAREQLGDLIIPSTVHLELGRNPHTGGRAALESAFAQGWIHVVALERRVPADLLAALDAGEAEALTLALQTKASLVLLDESAGRSCASQLAIPFTGVLGILRKARQTGRIPSLKTEIARLRTEARFFISPPLEKAVLKSVGEV